jgi:L-fuconolactonase
MIVDTHLHIWDIERNSYPWLLPSHGSIYRTFQITEAGIQLEAAGVQKAVLVQAMNSYEDTEYMFEAAHRKGFVAGVVGWVPLMKPDEAGKQLEVFTQNPVFKGVRHLIHDEADKDWVIRPEVIESLGILASFNLPFDVVAVFPHQLKHVPTLAERVPNLRMVIDHLAKPPLDPAQHKVWADQMRAAAGSPHVYAKVSGLNTTTADFANWTYSDIKPNIDFACQLFGADWLMFGSDWPVAILAGTYQKVWDETNKALEGYSQAEKDAILGGTAMRFYNLG